ncbi:MAG TPA: hypothetical protein VHQ03_07765, partial [Candidatus Dormibacteraeota bacterium]|nr:hypothetical protein [Candidatus Dormibacteraeota bacterium]
MASTSVRDRPHYLARLWSELGRMGGEHDAFIKVIIVEPIVKSTVLTLAAIGILYAGHSGWLDVWADYAENQLNLNVGRGIIITLLLRLLAYIGAFTHINVL